MPLTKPRPRSYSPSDVDKFSNIPADIAHITPDDNTNLRLGGGKIGKAEIQCRFLHKDSQWGRLHHRDGTAVCAGIIHMEIQFKNLRGCVLDSAVIRVVLDGEHQMLQRYRKIVGQEEQEEKLGFEKKKNTVEVTDVGPRSIVGTPYGVVKRAAFTINPTVEFEGVGLSAIQSEKSKEWTQITRWVFEGGTWASRQSNTVNSAEWMLTENVPERQPSHGNCFRTAFVFTNDGHPFLLRVEVEGSLSKFRLKAKERLKSGFRFGSSSAKQSPTTLIRGFGKETQRLNGLVASLNEDVNKLNKAVDFNRRMDGQAHDSGSHGKVRNQMDDENDEDATLKQHQEENNEDEAAGAKESTELTELTEFTEAVKMMAKSDKGNGHKGNPMGGSAHNTKPPLGTEAAQPQPKTVQEQESKALLNLFLEIFRELLARIQQLLMLG
ncbi:hypothetical protein B0T25DRAFT_266717 [Lasiosphaeria hispida]|uniref:Uncharacterized protein n=1 Tax=Lasiosphaeria hispida TaxID=260671 RepID=A0AAJ0HAK2_9PEZI|nr:hypothetical protein B0T25DRAFT_266717 [Lasiosphaeria hispida]